MVRIKNALTGYFVGPLPVGGAVTADSATLELAKWITTVTDDTDETIETTAFYDGDGTATQDVTGISKIYTFEGMYDDEDPGMKFIAGLELAQGEARKIAFKQVRSNGDELFGRATVTNIKVTGGAAEEYPVFEATIAWDVIPTVVSA